MTPLPSSVVRCAVAFALVLCVGGCARSIRPDCRGRSIEADLGVFDAVPVPRMGSLPHPGLVSLFAVADPGDLGAHVYKVGAPFESVGETERGTLYTARAGFLDLAHVRNTIDAAAHIHARMRLAFDRGMPCVRFRLAEPSVYTVEIEYTDAWRTLSPEEKSERVRSLAIDAACCLAFHAMNWHEILTWFGYRSTVIVPERGSAFSFEDVPSHAVGAIVAGRALRGTSDPGAAAYARVVDAELARMLGDLGAVDADATLAAIRFVEGEWWGPFGVRRWDVLGADPGGDVRPVLVPQRGGGGPSRAAELRVPRLPLFGASHGLITVRVLIDPRVLEEPAIGKVLSEMRGERWDGLIEVERDFPPLLRMIEAELAGTQRRDAD